MTDVPNNPASPPPSPAPSQPPASPPPAPPARPAAKKKPEPSGLASIADTIEAIIIALILALTFRAFVVEAFVIPTGSMAPTLLGAHFNVICPQCGQEFKEDVNLNKQWKAEWKDRQGNVVVRNAVRQLESRGELTDSLAIPAPDFRTCPNCGYAINVSSLPPLRPMVRTLSDGKSTSSFPWANNGDRILVLKYLYNFAEPERWDVIVFKEPMHASDNYIKRLIGLPGEKIEIIDGDVFVQPPARPGQPAPPASIARKPDHVQRAVWQLVYDNDHYPFDEGVARSDGAVWLNPWHGAGPTAVAWTIHGPELKYAVGQPGELAFGYDSDRPDVRAAQEKGLKLPNYYFYNVLGYNNDLARADHMPVGDLHAETLWTPASSADTRISISLGTESNRFRVTWSGNLLLERWDPAGKVYNKVSETPGPALQPGHSYRVACNNVDHQVQFFIDGRKVLEHQTPWTADQARAYSDAHEKNPEIPEARIQVGGACTLAHLKIMRDLYYTNINRDVPNEKGSGIAERYAGTGVKGHPVQLEVDEFFALGDNSTRSLDSRGWFTIDSSLRDLPLYQSTHNSGDEHNIPGYGRIPRRFLLGKAFFVYWPAGYRPLGGALDRPDSPYMRFDAPLVPNTGEMRFIR